jgi:hypothetical protein
VIMDRVVDELIVLTAPEVGTEGIRPCGPRPRRES